MTSEAAERTVYIRAIRKGDMANSTTATADRTDVAQAKTSAGKAAQSTSEPTNSAGSANGSEPATAVTKVTSPDSAEVSDREKLLRLLDELGEDRVKDLLQYGSSLKWQFGSFAEGLRQFGITKVPFTDGMSGVPEVSMDGRRLINFAPVNFLNLHSRPDVMDHFVSSARRFGLATGGARISQGVTRPHMDMEAELCRILGKERAISYATGMVANVGFIHAMSNKQSWSPEMAIDHTDVVFVYDRDNHWSLWKAAEKLEYGRTLFSFKHNNVEHLEQILKRLQGKRVVVVFESVYSVDGSVAPMHEIVDVCEKYGALSYVDDANGFLVYGAKHRPFAQEYAGMMRSTFIMVSLKKSVGLEGGMIAGPNDAIFAFEALGMASVFTAQVQPPTAATAAYSMRLLTMHEPQIIDNYLERVARFRGLLKDEGFRLNPTPSIMTSIDVGPESVGNAIKEAFLERGYRIPVYLFPAARRNHATMRLILNATHTDEHIYGFMNLMREFRGQFGL